MISFSNNDSNENPYNFAVTGTVIEVPTVQILDNSDDGFSTSGTWLSWTDKGRQFEYHKSGAGTDTASWTFRVTPGQYRIWGTWVGTGYSTAATAAEYTVLDGTTKAGMAAANQTAPPDDLTDQGKVWEQLGDSFVITGDTMVVRLGQSASGRVHADALRIERIGSAQPPAVQIADNSDTSFTTTGNWLSWTDIASGREFNYHKAGAGTDTASWTFNVTPGQYRVWGTWIGTGYSTAATAAQYTVLDGAIPAGTAQADQTHAPADLVDQGRSWKRLVGTFTITGPSLVVRVGQSASGRVHADAIRIERVGDLPSGGTAAAAADVVLTPPGSAGSELGLDPAWVSSSLQESAGSESLSAEERATDLLLALGMI
jgi:hypothetical protein